MTETEQIAEQVYQSEGLDREERIALTLYRLQLLGESLQSQGGEEKNNGAACT